MPEWTTSPQAGWYLARPTLGTSGQVCAAAGCSPGRLCAPAPRGREQLGMDAFIQGMCHVGGSAFCLCHVLSNKATTSCDPSPATTLPSTPCTRWLQIRFQGWWPEPRIGPEVRWWGLTSSPASSLGGAGCIPAQSISPARQKQMPEEDGCDLTSTSLAPLPMAVFWPDFVHLLCEFFRPYYVFWDHVADATW